LPNKRDLETLYRQMPRRYRFFTRILLKLPNPSMPFFVVKRFHLLEGLLYGLFLPIFMFLSAVFTLILFPTAMLAFAFPLNYIVLLILPSVLFVIFLRIELERTINWWRSVFDAPTEWDTSKSVDELLQLFKKQQNKTKNDKVA